MKILKRREAQKLQIGQYFTGKPCKYGHTANRYTQSGACSVCVAISSAAARGVNHDGIVVPREQIEIERKAKIAEMMQQKDERDEAMRKLHKIRVPIAIKDLNTVFELSIAMCLASYPVLTRSDVAPNSSPVRGLPLYEVNSPAEHIDLIRQVADELWRAIPKDIAGARARMLAQAEQMANDAACPAPEGWK